MNLFKKLLILIPFALAIGTMPVEAFSSTMPHVVVANQENLGQLIASRSMSLDDRYPIPSVKTVFRDNILLTLSYMSGSVKNASQVNWSEVSKPSKYVMTLKPGEVFAFHDDVLAQFA